MWSRGPKKSVLDSALRVEAKAQLPALVQHFQTQDGFSLVPRRGWQAGGYYAPGGHALVPVPGQERRLLGARSAGASGALALEDPQAPL